MNFKKQSRHQKQKTKAIYVHTYRIVLMFFFFNISPYHSNNFFLLFQRTGYFIFFLNTYNQFIIQRFFCIGIRAHLIKHIIFFKSKRMVSVIDKNKKDKKSSSQVMVSAVLYILTAMKILFTILDDKINDINEITRWLT